MTTMTTKARGNKAMVRSEKCSFILGVFLVIASLIILGHLFIGSGSTSAETVATAVSCSLA